MLSEFEFTINGHPHVVRGEPIDTNLLDYLRDEGLVRTWRSSVTDERSGLVALRTTDGMGRPVFRAVEAAGLLLPHLAGREILTAEELDYMQMQGGMEGLGRRNETTREGLASTPTEVAANLLEARTREDILTLGDMAGHFSCGGRSPWDWSAVERAGKWISEERRTGKVSWMGGISGEASPAGFCYTDCEGRRFYRCTSVEEAIRLRAQYPRALVIANGFLATRALPQVDLTRGAGFVLSLDAAADLTGVLDHGDAFEVGAALPLSSVAEAIRDDLPGLANAIHRTASRPVLHRLTLGGVAATGSRFEDLACALLLEEVELSVVSSTGERTVSYSQFLSDSQNRLEENEWIRSFRLASSTIDPGRSIYSFERVASRWAGGAPVIALGCRLGFSDEGEIESARLAVGCHGGPPQRLEEVAAGLCGKKWGVETVKEAAAAIRKGAGCADDEWGSGEYRTTVVGAIWQKIFVENPAPGVRQSLQPEFETSLLSPMTSL